MRCKKEPNQHSSVICVKATDIHVASGVMLLIFQICHWIQLYVQSHQDGFLGVVVAGTVCTGDSRGDTHCKKELEAVASRAYVKFKRDHWDLCPQTGLHHQMQLATGLQHQMQEASI